MRRTRICVVQGDSLLAEGIDSMLRSEKWLEVVSVMSGEGDLSERLRQLHPDIILVDRGDPVAISILQSRHLFDQEQQARLIIVDLSRSRINVHHIEEAVVTGKDALIDVLRRLGRSGHSEETGSP